MRTQKTIAIIGGGVSGALTAYHLVRNEANARIVLIDPRPELGLGLAYSTPSYRHLLNVPAGKISALPDQPDHFLRWLNANYDANLTAADFAPRAVFGRYIQSLIEETPGLEHLQSFVRNLRVDRGRAVLDLADGATLVADAVVIATIVSPPSRVRVISALTAPLVTLCTVPARTLRALIFMGMPSSRSARRGFFESSASADGNILPRCAGPAY